MRLTWVDNGPDVDRELLVAAMLLDRRSPRRCRIFPTAQFLRVEQGTVEAVLDGVAHHTRVGAEADNAHFDGKTTE